MTVMALLMLAAAPNLYQQIRREKEQEAIHRGNEIAEAILIYMNYNNGQPPKSMDDLLKGVQVPGRTKRLMILRESAAKDPLSSSGEWKLIQDSDKVLQNFSRKVFTYNDGVPLSNPGQQGSPTRQRLDTATVRFRVNLDVETTEETDPPGGEDETDNVEGAFIGVASRSQRKSVLTFYGIERHDWWVFTPLFRGTDGSGGAMINQGGRGLDVIERGRGNPAAPPPPLAPSPRF